MKDIHYVFLGNEQLGFDLSVFDILSIPNPNRHHTQVYGSNLYWKQSSEEFSQQIENFNFSNTSILKFHLGRMSPSDEREYYECIADNQNIEKFMIDLNCGYDLSQISELSKYLSEIKELSEKLIWIEEPTHPDLSQKWKNNTPFTLAAGENHHGIKELTELSRNGVDWIMPDFGRTLRLSEFPLLLKKINKTSSISFHSYSSGFLGYLSLLISTSLPRDKTLYEHDFSENALLTDITQDALIIKNGEAHIDPNALHELNLDNVNDSWSKNSISLASFKR